MPTVISQRELRNASADIMDRVEQGESFTVTRRNKPLASLSPLTRPTPVEPERFVPVEHLLARLSPVPAGTFEAMRREADDFFADGGDRLEH
jgi:prevent-host-death family protein